MGFIEVILIIIIILSTISITSYLIRYNYAKKHKTIMKKSKINQFLKSIKSKIYTYIKRLPVKKTLLGILGFVFVLVIVLSFLKPTKINSFINGEPLSNIYEYTDSSQSVIGYTNAYLNYQNKDIYEDNVTFNVTDANGLKISKTDENYGQLVLMYESFLGKQSDVLLLDDENEVSFNVGNISEGLYYLSIDYFELSELIDATQIDIRINGVNPYYEAQTLILPSFWALETTDFKLDRYLNEIQPQSKKISEWMNHSINDLKGLHKGLFLFPLKANDIISIHYVNQELLLGNLYFVQGEDIPSYESYLSKNPQTSISNTRYQVSAKEMYKRTDPSIRLRPDQDPSHMNYHTQHLKLNVIFAESWQNGGQRVSYKFDVKASGYYALSVKYRQYIMKDMPVFRKIYINGEVPFKEFESYAFPYSTSFTNRTLVDDNGENLLIYLNQGENEISFETVMYPYRHAIEKIKEIMSKIQSLALEVKRYTAGGTDPYRDWDIDKYFPNAQSDIYRWADELDQIHKELSTLSHIKNPSEISNLKVASSRLRSIALEINRLPSRMVQFSDGDSSVNQLIGFLMQRLMVSPLEIERTIVSVNAKLDRPYADIFTSTFEGVKRLILSYINNPYSVGKNNDNDLVVWVNHSRQYIEIMQAMIDSNYDGEYRVTLSQMPDQNKLILANTSGKSPDVAIGVDHWIPYDFAIRNASLDLRQFSGYEETVKDFSKGAMIPYVFEDGVFGLPETQNFWVTYYRKDILSNIGIEEVPTTWEEIIEILPLLQSYGLNYFIPLAQYTGLKPFVATLPFIHQFGGDLYTEDGMQTAINSEETLQGIKLMSDLFTLYNMPKYVASFYNNFRYGTLPIGVSDLSTYILLQTAAKELDGLWSMALHPGYYNENLDEVVRFASSGAQSSMILSSTNKKQAAWDFLSWWMSEDVQAEFAFSLQATYGKAYFWNTANVKAFERISMPKVYKDVVLEQWKYAIEAARIPGTYMVEREISNAWTSIVFDGTNARQALDQAVRISNREILYKMQEFGYVENGVIIKNYPVPNIYNIDRWLEERK